MVFHCTCITKHQNPSFHEHDCPVYMEWKIAKLEAQIESINSVFIRRMATTEKEVYNLIDTLKIVAKRRLDKHGYGLAAGPHEIFGIIAEEMDELTDEMRSNDHQKFTDELIDVAIAAIFGIVSMQVRMEFDKGKS